MITAEEDERLITKEKLSLLAPQLFSAPGESSNDEHRSRTSVFLKLREHLVAQDNQVLQSVPEPMRDLAAALLNRATSIALSQKDLALIREEDCNNANHALAEASLATQKADAILRPLEELNRKDQELVKQNKDLKKEVQELVRVHNNLQKNFESLSEAYAIMSQSFMTKGEEEMPQKGRGRKRKQSAPPSTSQLVIKDTGVNAPAEEAIPEQPARRLRSMVTRGTKSLMIT